MIADGSKQPPIEVEESEAEFPEADLTADDSEDERDKLVPVWLAALVLLLLLAVMGIGGYIVGIFMQDSSSSDPNDFEIQRWEKAVEQDPRDSDALLQLGFAYQQAERYEEAIEEYDEVLKYYPADTAALYNKGISFEGDLLDLGAECNVIEKSGAWYSYGDERIGQGRENARRFMIENPDIRERIAQQVYEAKGLKRAVPTQPEEVIAEPQQAQAEPTDA